MNRTAAPYIKYTGAALDHYDQALNLAAYIPSPELIQAVEIARLLGRPLLLRGEPGSGKTRLAEAIAVELHGEDHRQFYFPWPIKSTTRAQEGLYEFDHLERMQDLYRIRATDEQPAKDLNEYVERGAIGLAYQKMNAFPEKQPPVILIDEIDKADIDFPNDLLWELERREFFIKEIRDHTGSPKREGIDNRQHAPIVIITSNDEKELPNAFLRRCVFHYINFPKRKQLKDIIREYLVSLEQGATPHMESYTEKMLDRFEAIRAKLRENPNAVKPPSTSELLDWAHILAIYLGKEEWSVDQDMNLLCEEEVEDEQGYLIKRKTIRIRPEDILLKNRDDRRLI